MELAFKISYTSHHSLTHQPTHSSHSILIQIIAIPLRGHPVGCCIHGLKPVCIQRELKEKSDHAHGFLMILSGSKCMLTGAVDAELVWLSVQPSTCCSIGLHSRCSFRAQHCGYSFRMKRCGIANRLVVSHARGGG